MKLSHVRADGKANMVDVGEKARNRRTATAMAVVIVSKTVMRAIRKNLVQKGDVIGVARIAAIQAAKRTPELIPLCHPIALTSINVEIATKGSRVHIVATVHAEDRTGVEMEALTAATVAALTIYDMCKALDKSMEIAEIRLLEKTGGKSGVYRRKPSARKRV